MYLGTNEAVQKADRTTEIIMMGVKAKLNTDEVGCYGKGLVGNVLPETLYSVKLTKYIAKLHRE